MMFKHHRTFHTLFQKVIFDSYNFLKYQMTTLKTFFFDSWSKNKMFCTICSLFESIIVGKQLSEDGKIIFFFFLRISMKKEVLEMVK